MVVEVVLTELGICLGCNLPMHPLKKNGREILGLKGLRFGTLMVRYGIEARIRMEAILSCLRSF